MTIKFVIISLFSIYSKVQTIKNIANFPVNSMVTSIFYHELCVFKKYQKNLIICGICMNTKKPFWKDFFLSVFVRAPLCASLDSGIGRCHQGQSWRYQGAAVMRAMIGKEFVTIIRS